MISGGSFDPKDWTAVKNSAHFKYIEIEINFLK